MKNIFNRFYVVLFFMVVVSCKKDLKTIKSKEGIDTLDDGFIELHNIKQKDTKILSVDFVNETYLNKIIPGNLVYDLKIDTIKPSEIGKRFVLLTVSTDNNAEKIDEIENTAQDGLLDTTSVNRINFSFKVKFLEIGNKDLKLSIRDIIYLKTKDTISDIPRLERHYIYKQHVYVRDNTSVIGYKGDTISQERKK